SRRRDRTMWWTRASSGTTPPSSTSCSSACSRSCTGCTATAEGSAAGWGTRSILCAACKCERPTRPQRDDVSVTPTSSPRTAVPSGSTRTPNVMPRQRQRDVGPAASTRAERSGAVDGTAELAGPADPLAGLAPAELPRLLRKVYASAVGGSADDWAALD